MPTVIFPLDHAGRPVVELYVGISAAARETLEAPGAAPPPLRVRALVDTGATLTVVERGYLEQLGVEKTGTTRLHSSTTGGEPVPALVYAVSLALAGDVTGVLAPDLEVLAVEDLGGLGVQALLGRDILNRCSMHYDGPGGSFALTFRPLEGP
jgi:predicted aspartyl protease